jgi:transcriptional regulator with PAS, ATPase and Fis domain
LREQVKRKVLSDEKGIILQALEKARYHKSAAAGQLGISRTTLWRKMKELGLD